MNNKITRPQQFYGWFWAQNTKMSSKLRTFVVLWMVLGPDKISMTTKLLELSSYLDGFGPNGKITTELLDLSCFMDGFGPYGLSVIKTADLGSSMDGFGPNEKSNKTAGRQQFYGWFGL